MEHIIRTWNKMAIRQREDGYLSLTDMAQACGKLVGGWLRLKSTVEFLEVLNGRRYADLLDTLLPKGEEILDSTSPLRLDPLRYLSQRWFSPQALTFRVPLGSWITPKNLFELILCRLAPMKILPIPGQELELWNRTPYLQLSRYRLPLGS